MKKLFSVLTFVLLLCSVVIAAAAFTPQSPPVTQLLTDRSLTTYNADRPEIALASSGLHVIWPEHGLFDPGNNMSDMDLFYAVLPGNNTQRIRDTDAVTSGQGYTAISYPHIALGTNGQAHLAWIEPTATYGSDVFFWKTGMASPLNISDHALTGTGAAATLFFTLDSNNVPHALWIERETSYYSVFYWKEGSSTTKLSVVTPPVASLSITSALALISHNGVTHAFWRDHSPTVTFDLYYWNSSTQTVANMRTGQPPLSGPLLNERAFVSPDGTFHAVWHELHSDPPEKIVHWDSGTATYHTILTGSLLRSMPATMDNTGRLHVVNYMNNGPLNYWNSQTLSNQQLTANIGTMQPGVASGKGSIPVYVTWPETDPNHPGHLHDLFYWHPGMAQAQNISDHSQPPADISSPGRAMLAAADDGSVHIAWEEGRATYYHSDSNNTTTLNNSALYIENTINNKLDNPYLAYAGTVFRVYHNTAYWFMGSAGPTPFTLWRSDDNSYTPIPPSPGTIGGHDLPMLWFDRFGQPQLAWTADVTDELSNLHYWNSQDGSINVSDNQNTSRNVGLTRIIGATDATNRVYLIWLEDADSPEYMDVFAAIREPVFDQKLYAPLIQR